jgi:GNAT superfamily N-acetyltransferase
MINKKNYRQYAIGFSLLVTLSLVVGYFHVYQCKNSTISPYNKTTDRAFILDIFKQDWHWLVSEHSVHFSPEYMLDNQASSKRPEHLGNLTVNVMRTCDGPVGFVAFYKKSFYLGYILFLDILKEFRGKGYAYMLLSDSVRRLKERGCSRIQLITRTTNFSAQKLYTRFGFVQIERDEGFITYQYGDD